MKTIEDKIIIGRREEVDFPVLGLFGITAKIDTGAYTSSLHCYDIREEKGVLYFKLLNAPQAEFKVQDQKFTDYSQKNIKNSFGEIEKRYIIKTSITIGGKHLKTLISLTDRGTMRYPVLIGRKLLRKRFIVDVSLVNNLLAEVVGD
jgi:hypothetical protein